MDDRFKALRDATAAALLRSPGTTPEQLREAVANGQAPPELAALVQKIRTRAYTVTDQDIDALRSTYTEDQLFEIIVASAFGAARDRLSSALKAVEEA
jgi:alkylhydroperoxidase family enzyme